MTFATVLYVQAFVFLYKSANNGSKNRAQLAGSFKK